MALAISEADQEVDEFERSHGNDDDNFIRPNWPGGKMTDGMVKVITAR